MSNCISHDGSVPAYVQECPSCTRLRAELQQAQERLKLAEKIINELPQHMPRWLQLPVRRKLLDQWRAGR